MNTVVQSQHYWGGQGELPVVEEVVTPHVCARNTGTEMKYDKIADVADGLVTLPGSKVRRLAISCCAGNCQPALGHLFTNHLFGKIPSCLTLQDL